MLTAFLKNLVRRPNGHVESLRPHASAPLRLHIGGRVRHPDWKVLNVVPGPHVDYVGNCTDLSRFGAASVSEIYASHVLEHLSYQSDLPKTLTEFHRVLVPGGVLRVSVPDLATLCALFQESDLTAQDRYAVMRMMFGGQVDPSDFHHVGLSEEFLAAFLRNAGFNEIERVDDLGVFDDTSRLVFHGRLISLNMVARKPGPPR